MAKTNKELFQGADLVRAWELFRKLGGNVSCEKWLERHDNALMFDMYQPVVTEKGEWGVVVGFRTGDNNITAIKVDLGSRVGTYDLYVHPESVRQASFPAGLVKYISSKIDNEASRLARLMFDKFLKKLNEDAAPMLGESVVALLQAGSDPYDRDDDDDDDD